MNKIHRISSEEIQILRSENSDDIVVEGYAAKYNALSLLLSANGRQFKEKINSGAFKEALENLWSQKVDCVATYEHKRDSLLARTSSGTLKLWEDKDGLKFKFTVPNTTIGRDVAEMLRRGDLTQCSFKAHVNRGDYVDERTSEGYILRTINKFSIIKDVALVIDPAYPDTYAEEVKRSIDEFEAEEQAEIQAEEERQAVEAAKVKAAEEAKEKEKADYEAERSAQVENLDNIISNFK